MMYWHPHIENMYLHDIKWLVKVMSSSMIVDINCLTIGTNRKLAAGAAITVQLGHSSTVYRCFHKQQTPVWYKANGGSD